MISCLFSSVVSVLLTCRLFKFCEEKFPPTLSLPEGVKKSIWFLFASFRRKPESSVFRVLRTDWTPVFTGVTAEIQFFHTFGEGREGVVSLGCGFAALCSLAHEYSKPSYFMEFIIECRGGHAQGVMAARKMGNPGGLPLQLGCSCAAPYC